MFSRNSTLTDLSIGVAQPADCSVPKSQRPGKTGMIDEMNASSAGRRSWRRLLCVRVDYSQLCRNRRTLGGKNARQPRGPFLDAPLGCALCRSAPHACFDRSLDSRSAIQQRQGPRPAEVMTDPPDDFTHPRLSSDQLGPISLGLPSPQRLAPSALRSDIPLPGSWLRAGPCECHRRKAFSCPGLSPPCGSRRLTCF